MLGLGKSGYSAALYLAKRGARVFASELSAREGGRAKLAEDLESAGIRLEFGRHTDEALTWGDSVIVSPGIPPFAEAVRKARQSGSEIICDIELAFRQTDVPIIAVTGTNGKSTTCSLVSHMLASAGKKAPACGNFGEPVLAELEKAPDYLVVEVSSFQLEYCSRLSPFVAVWLNLTPDHLDWHGSLDAYIEAKRRLFAQQRANSYAVLNLDDSVVSATQTQAEIFPFSVKQSLAHVVQGAFIRDGFLCYRYLGESHLVLSPQELKIRGEHNMENALAAISVCAPIGLTADDMAGALRTFKPLEHRLEHVGCIDGIDYYNDSKATNTTSAVKALGSFPQRKVVLIAGGRDKGTPLIDFVEAVKRHAAFVVLIGEAAPRFEQDLRAAGFESIACADTLAEATEMAGQLKAGPVLLSPACSSFDMFSNYEERGRVFKDIVGAKATRLTPSG